MKSFVLIERQDELDILKERVRSGETIYTLFNNQTFLISHEIDEYEKDIYRKVKVGKREIDSFFRYFQPSEIETKDYSTDFAENTPPKATESTTNRETEKVDKRFDFIETRLKSIEKALSTNILSKLIQIEE